MQDWMVFGLLSLLCWGLWGLFPKLASQTLPPQSAVLFNIMGSAAFVALFIAGNFLLNPGFSITFEPRGVAFAAMAGMAGVTGSIFLYFALSRGGNASVVVPMTALYPMITAFLALVFLQEAITFKQALGMGFAFVAIALFSF